MIFAAGFGTRMGKLIQDRPKPMIEVAGRTMIDRAVDLGEAAGAAPIVANTHYLHHVITPTLHARGVTISPETEQILDTGGGLRHARLLLGQSETFTLNPDSIFTGPNPLLTLANAWRPEMTALLLCVPLSRAKGRKGGGDFSVDAGGRLTRKGDLVYIGAQIINADILTEEADEVFSLAKVWFRLAEQGKLHGVIHPGTWADVGHPDGIALAEKMLSGV
ncbi:hypothetical protein PAA8504_00999 [Palleronia abyssalis]|uniref:MobA-like NTP transferase domain-containing protein n=2 Tax=Palleronia abyssalis TaxID=1501240 RepID=A0A2R8BSP5_9RHOB|nr:hypothetical protein PAA8504_00999 [Palleronia abyssalis]